MLHAEVGPLPVFYDRTGRRKFYAIAIALLSVVALGAGAFFVHGSIMVPAEPPVTHQDISYPEQILSKAEIKDIPLVGDTKEGVLNRIVLTQREGSNVNLVDPYSGQIIRAATDEEKVQIGQSPYAMDSYGRPKDGQLMLTFDDGPDAKYTPELLDLLSREGVQATFFVVGKSVAQHPEILRRIVKEGHMVGNHTTTHISSREKGRYRNRGEIVVADRLIRSTANYATQLYRIPEGDPDNNAMALMRSQQLGYVHVDMDMDTRDWENKPGQPITPPSLDGRGHVVLMHDGGGDRSATIKMVETFIAQAKSRGYTFSTVQPLLSPEHVPRHDVDSTFADKATYQAARMAWVIPAQVLAWLFWIGVGSMTFMSMVYLVLALWAQYRACRRAWPDLAEDQLPSVCVVLSAFNEEDVIAKTLDELRKSVYPTAKLRVIAVDDGSTDGTLAILREYAQTWPGLTVLHQTNQGKPAALNRAIEASDDTVIVTIDADTLFRPDTVYMFARHFVKNRRVGAVAGHVKVGNRRNILTAWQSLEYISGICVTRMAEGAMNAISIVPGACAAWRRTLVINMGGFSGVTMAEDADLTLMIQRRGYKVVQENNAVADTEAPETMRKLARQRLRWTYGNIQALRKHHSMLLRPKYGMLGMVTMPYALMSLIVPLVFMPATVVVAVLSIVNGNWQSVLLFAGFVAGVHMMISVVAVLIVREKLWHLLVVPIYRLIYEPLRAYLLYASLVRVIKGTVFEWDKLERTNSVVAHSAG